MNGIPRLLDCAASRLAAGVFILSCLFVAGGAAAQGEGPGPPPAPTAAEVRALQERIEELEKAKPESEAAARERERLERRVEELESSQVAHEDATRSILLQTFQTLGSKINEFVTLGGVIEVLARSEEEFVDDSTNPPRLGVDRETIQLDVAELQLETQVTDWARGNLVVEYNDGTDNDSNVDRINIDTAEVTVGNTERFWPFGRFGRAVVPFGISTGDPVADVLTLADPLTVEAFETKRDAMLIGIEFPTPALTPEIVTAAPPRPQPLVLTPLVRRLALWLGYKPLPTAPPLPVYLTPSANPAPFTAAVYFYNGSTYRKGRPNQAGEWDPMKHFGATAGYRTKGQCRSHLDNPEATGRLRWLRILCPWTLDADVDFNRSIFESRFLTAEYQLSGATDFGIPGRNFLEQIGIVSGMAAHLKASLGPVSLVAEWNGALDEEEFLDDSFLYGDEALIRMQPSAWQVSVAYQFDWNPSVESIGAQGTYVAFSYSKSQDLAGVTFATPNPGSRPIRVGFVPKQRIAVDVGEWVHENLRVAVEYSYELDYERNQAGVRFDELTAPSGATGRETHGFSAVLTFDW